MEAGFCYMTVAFEHKSKLKPAAMMDVFRFAPQTMGV